MKADATETGLVSRRISITLATLGFSLGVIAALTVLSGDAHGRVNLLYLLLLFVLLPAIGLILSVVFLLRNSARGLSGWLLDLPFWPDAWTPSKMQISSAPGGKVWLFYQTQILALFFGIGGVATFMLLLLGTDISFVWRSTILETEDLLPWIQGLSRPWWFWKNAQPTAWLLEASKDTRALAPSYTAEVLGQWWRYVLAAQCTYNLLPRFAMLLVARLHVRLERDRSDPIRKRPEPPANELAPLVERVDEPFRLVNWARAPLYCLDHIEKQLGKPEEVKAAEPDTEPTAFEKATLRNVVVVKAWNPPMGELEDFLRDLEEWSGSPELILPLDWDDQGVRAVSEVHMSEWRRCAAKLDWRVLQIGA